MPFAVFRRHQRKLLAIFAILAMFGFVLADSLPRLFNSNSTADADPIVVQLKERTVRSSEVAAMAGERSRASRFIAELALLIGGRPINPAQIFGDVTTRPIVDAIILQQEADALKMPADPEVAKEWLKQRTGGLVNADLFEEALRRSGVQVTGEQILTDIANQVRLANARQLLGDPIVTPLDVFQSYRDQNERVSVRAVPFRVEDYVARVPAPTEAQVRAYYDKYKDLPPDPARDTPGFRIPRQIQAEILSIDGATLARQMQEKLTEAELLSYYENRKSEFAEPPGELPQDLFADDPGAALTPPLVRPFSDVRSTLASALAEEKAQAEIADRFARIRDDVLIPFADAYLDAFDKQAEARKQGETPTVALPKPESLKDVAAKAGMNHEITRLLTREQAEQYGQVSGAELGLSRLSGGKRFAAEFFDAKSGLFEPQELTDPQGIRFLVRKIADLPSRTPPLQEVRPKVVQAWKLEQARGPAETAAKEFAETVRRNGGVIKDDQIKDRSVVITDPVTRLQPGTPLPGQFFESGPPTETEIRQIPDAGEALRNALFDLTPKSVAVVPNQPKTIYYVLAQDRREPASFAALYAPNGDYMRYLSESMGEAQRRRDDEWMNGLRRQAGLKLDWKPRDEINREEEEASPRG